MLSSKQAENPRPKVENPRPRKKQRRLPPFYSTNFAEEWEERIQEIYTINDAHKLQELRKAAIQLSGQLLHFQLRILEINKNFKGILNKQQKAKLFIANNNLYVMYENVKKLLQESNQLQDQGSVEHNKFSLDEPVAVDDIDIAVDDLDNFARAIMGI